MNTKTNKTKTNKSPKWGTREWIMAYPWSKMDKDRRRRVRKVLKDEYKSLLEPMVSVVEYIDSLYKTLAKADIDVQKEAYDETKVAAAKVDDFMTCTRDTLIAQALYQLWCRTTEEPGECCSDKKPCKKPCKQTCKQTCKKPAKAKK